MIGGIVAAVAVIAIVVVLLLTLGGGSEPASDEEQIRAVVAELEEAWNNYRFDAITELACAMSRGAINEESLSDERDEDGRVEFTVKSVEVQADTATASIEERYSNVDEPDTSNVEFVREGGAWRVCD